MEHALGNIFIRPMELDAVGSTIDGHTHNFDHVTYVVRGAVKFEKLDADGNVLQTIVKRASDGYNYVLIKAEAKHRITSLEANSLAHCVYAHRYPQNLEEVLANRPAQGQVLDAYNAKLAELRALSNQLFGDVVQVYDGWTSGYV